MEDEEEAQEQRIFFWEVLYIDSALVRYETVSSMFQVLTDFLAVDRLVTALDVRIDTY